MAAVWMPWVEVRFVWPRNRCVGLQEPFRRFVSCRPSETFGDKGTQVTKAVRFLRFVRRHGSRGPLLALYSLVVSRTNVGFVWKLLFESCFLSDSVSRDIHCVAVRLKPHDALVIVSALMSSFQMPVRFASWHLLEQNN